MGAIPAHALPYFQIRFNSHAQQILQNSQLFFPLEGPSRSKNEGECDEDVQQCLGNWYLLPVV